MINLMLAMVPRQFGEGMCGHFINSGAMMVTCNKIRPQPHIIFKTCPKKAIDCNVGTKIKESS